MIFKAVWPLRYNRQVWARARQAMSNLIVLGAQWGDEGKGKIVDLLSEKFDAVARYQGGHNAGIPFSSAARKFVLKLIPSGILRPGVLAVIGNGVVVDPGRLLEEISVLEAAGVDVRSQLQDQQPGARHLSVSPHDRKDLGGPRKPDADRNDIARHRPLLRRQDRAPRHPHR